MNIEPGEKLKIDVLTQAAGFKQNHRFHLLRVKRCVIDREPAAHRKPDDAEPSQLELLHRSC